MKVKTVFIRGDFQRMKGIHLGRMLGSLERGGVRVANLATQLAPRDTGLLASTITATVPEPAGGAGAYHFAVRIGPVVDYGAAQELGTARMRAHPYLRPAIAMLRAQLVAQMATDVVEGG